MSFLQIPFTFKETFIRESHREENKPQNTHTIDPDKISDEIAKKVTTQILNQFFQPGDLTLNKLNQFSTFMDNSINQAQAKLPKISETQEKILSQEKEFFHAEDYCSAFYNGEPYTFTLAQARVVKELHEAYLNKIPEVRIETLLHVSDTNSTRMRDIFKNCPNWRNLIVRGKRKGTYRLKL